MTTYEKLNQITTDLAFENAPEEYNKKEADLVAIVGEYVLGNEVICQTYGTGKIVNFDGPTLEGLIVEVQFEECAKKFSLKHIITVARFIKLADIAEIGDVWDLAMEVHTVLTAKLNEIKRAIWEQKKEAEKKAIEEKKYTEKYEKTKAKAIKDFEAIASADRPAEVASEFYYSLGWLAKHVGTVSAALPDYLADSFSKHFGPDTGARIVDSKKRTINGNSMQWTFGFTANLKKPENMPAYLQQYLSTTGKAIANTSFIWDLVDNYGFQFGKKQDLDKIRSHVPTSCLASFEAGLA
jgi:hypothetical protein